MQLAPEEPEAGPWRTEPLRTVIEAPTMRHHREWMAEEIPFNAAQRTWERADVIVCGTPEIPYDPGTEIVVARPKTIS